MEGVSEDKMHVTRWPWVWQDDFPPKLPFPNKLETTFFFHKVRSILTHPMALSNLNFQLSTTSCCQGPTLQSIDQAESGGKLWKNTSLWLISLVGEPTSDLICHHPKDYKENLDRIKKGPQAISVGLKGGI